MLTNSPQHDMILFNMRHHLVLLSMKEMAGIKCRIKGSYLLLFWCNVDLFVSDLNLIINCGSHTGCPKNIEHVKKFKHKN